MSDTIKVVISYAHKDEQCMVELRDQFAPWVNKGDIELWTDNYILPGQEWNEEIIARLKEADVIIMLFSANFFTSNYIQNIEYKIALDRHNRGEALAVGVVVKPCNWEVTEMGKYQVLPAGAGPISCYRPMKRAGIYQQVSATIMDTAKAFRKARKSRKKRKKPI